MSLRRIERLVDLINTNIHTFGGKLSYQRVTEGLIKLVEAVEAFEGETESIWSIGEGMESLDDLLEGAYWHYVHHSNGQDSQEYLAQCVIGRIVQPGHGSENDFTSESMTYNNLESMAGNERS